MTLCDICGELRGRLDKHYRDEHKLNRVAAKAWSKVQKASANSGGKVYTCPECNKVVRYQGHLRNMQSIEEKTKSPKYARH